MTRDEEHAYNEGKLAAWKDHRDQHLGSRAKCPFVVADRVRAWQQGYHDQATALNPTVQLDAEAEQRRIEFVAACQDWLARNAK
jgi:ribosome assembly protein YihI (activator of Der GTPase)